MSKLLKPIILLLLLLVIPAEVFAQQISFPGGGQAGYFNFSGGPGSIVPSFTPSPTDLSLSYLGQIFGTVGTVLHGTSGQMLGQLFLVFNIGILVLAGIFLIYTIVMTVLNTAHEGEFMGRKWNSAWIAIRTVLGLGLLVPSPTTGYSIIQVIVMWVVIQGAGFANMAWFNALGYLASGGEVYTPPATDTATMVDLAGNILDMQVCMYYAQNAAQTTQKNLQQNAPQQTSQGGGTNTVPPTPIITTNTNFTPLFKVYQPSGSQLWNSVVVFPGNPFDPGQQDNSCGEISFGTNTDQNALMSDQKMNTLKAAVQQMMMDTDSFAQQIAAQSSTASNFSNQVESAIVGSAADWVNITLPIRTGGPSVGQALMAGFYGTAVSEGWIMAGRYYYALGNIRQAVSAASSVAVTINAAPSGFSLPPSGSYMSFLNTPVPNTYDMSNLHLSTADLTGLVNVYNNAASFVISARSVANQVDQTSKVNFNIGASGILAFLLDPVSSFLLTLIATISTAVGDPILILQGLGYGFMTLASGLWLGATVSAFSLGLGTSILSSVQPGGDALLDAVITFIPMFTAFIMTFFVMGATFAYYIPLIPFIIFVFSAVGWLISVIEAMVAAPLVALGITHPEGHDLLGKSEQAIMLLLSVFLRPILMIIGLFAGMIVSRVVLRFLNTGFFGIVFDVEQFNLFSFIGVLVIYTFLVVTVVNQSFALIYVIPDRVMKWIGAGDTSTHAQEALQGSKQGYEQYSGAAGELGKGASSAGSSGLYKSAKAIKADRDAKASGASAKPMDDTPEGR
jgi:defect-in-organelle-trafficking protein DotA